MERGHSGETASNSCLTAALGRIGEKWTVLVVLELASEPKRFSALRRSISGVSQKMLANTLRGLERDGFVTRTVHPTKPPSVEYDLTDLGRDIVGPLKDLAAWISDNLHRIDIARRRFDAERGDDDLEPGTAPALAGEP